MPCWRKAEPAGHGSIEMIGNVCGYQAAHQADRNHRQKRDSGAGLGRVCRPGDDRRKGNYSDD